MHLPNKEVDVAGFPISRSTSSKGNQRKWSDGGIWLKAPFEYQGRYWKDYLVEIIAADIGDQLRFNVVPQGLAKIILDDKEELDGCWSKDFLPPDYSYVSFYRLISVHGPGMQGYTRMIDGKPPVERFEIVSKIIFEKTGLDATRYLKEMVTLDYLVGNEDRHINNFGVLWCATTNAYAIAPLFDNGLGMFEHDTAYGSLPLSNAVRRMKGKPFSTNLEKVVDAIDLSALELSKKIINLDGLEFPNRLAKPYLLKSAEHLGIEVW